MSLRIYGNRLIQTLPGQEMRPTLAKVRQAVFNIWQGTIADCRWLDLCAGSGSMGAEALCRGARSATAIDQSPQACDLIDANWRQLAKPDQTMQVLRGNVLKRLQGLAGQQFDRIYFDPPYASDVYEPVLQTVADLKLLAAYGEMAVEQNAKCDRLEIAGLEICREKRYGNTALTFYRNLEQ
jgi:16S rRNA (guanine(966)-N(2))-methyltransferase RsmD